jgi:hypothetical protein
MAWFWMAICIKECRLWEIMWDVLNTHGQWLSAWERKPRDLGVQTSTTGPRKTKELGAGDKVIHSKQSQLQVRMGWPPSQFWFWERFWSCYLEGVPFWARFVVGGSFSSLSQRCHRSFLSFLDFKLAAGENGSEQRTIDKMERCHVFLFLVNLWAQVGSQCLLIQGVQVPREPGN